MPIKINLKNKKKNERTKKKKNELAHRSCSNHANFRSVNYKGKFNFLFYGVNYYYLIEPPTFNSLLSNSGHNYFFFLHVF